MSQRPVVGDEDMAMAPSSIAHRAACLVALQPTERRRHASCTPRIALGATSRRRVLMRIMLVMLAMRPEPLSARHERVAHITTVRER